MMKLQLILVLGIFSQYRPSEALSCPPPWLVTCEGEAPVCPFGTTTDVCGVCPECYKGPGEECGGPWDIAGECGEDLHCEKEVLPGQLEFNLAGVCEPITENNAIDFPDRKKRGLSGGRRAGLSRVQARVHSRNQFAGVPDHILEMLRKKGVRI